MSEKGRRIVVIGAGFSGSLLSVQLLRRSEPEDRVFLVERSAAFGRGLAYATANARHLLNVRAGNMSAFSDRPDHFLDWVRALPEADLATVQVTVDRLTFVPRRLYGTYIQHILSQEIASEDDTDSGQCPLALRGVRRRTAAAAACCHARRAPFPDLGTVREPGRAAHLC